MRNYIKKKRNEMKKWKGGGKRERGREDEGGGEGKGERGDREREEGGRRYLLL